MKIPYIPIAVLFFLNVYYLSLHPTKLLSIVLKSGLFSHNTQLSLIGTAELLLHLPKK